MNDDTVNTSNRLYHYMKAKYAVQTIETDRLKVTRLAELNDPFDLTTAIEGVPDGTTEEKIHKLENLPIDTLNAFCAMLCFSTTISDPALWTHYADGHSGVALAFERLTRESPDQLLPDVFEVSYTDSDGRPQVLRPSVDVGEWREMPSERKLGKALATFERKAFSWHYEKEVRVFCLLAACIPANGMYWCRVNTPQFKLVQVVPGIRCQISDDYFRKSLITSGFTDVEVKRAKRSRTKYEVEV